MTKKNTRPLYQKKFRDKQTNDYAYYLQMLVDRKEMSQKEFKETITSYPHKRKNAKVVGRLQKSVRASKRLL